MNRSAKKNRVRNGVLKMEAMLALVILVAAMNLASPLIHRINLLWSDAQRHQFAIQELANQLNGLTGLTSEAAQSALDEIEVSPACKKTLNEAAITGELQQDELGTRVTLQLSWSDRKNANPVTLSGWLRNTGADQKSDSREDQK
ncbi:hypothetical protein [Mariniblastus fucicola]|uniref:Uncharacterized protein n=1 Tax=Mariniblastus fucicola TaxID=980251 RepID=A0A5B9P7D9_9BACT|nr:hypothetical protein [Mariniblastus fucicola]QEG20516.1 hypothetical protein MFFC18_03650 [Mariniblastus fucicola]